MAQKLTGLINLSKIPKGIIGKTKKGESCIFVDVIPRKGGADEYGNTHSITIYNKETKETIYLGNLKPQEFGGGGSQASQSAPQGGGFEGDKDDLPF